jgi:CMP-N-acetylneuraminic acid synthetase
MVSKSIAIIPARGGSKRIPMKNLLDFNGKPVIGWTIEAAINSNLFSKVLVSTDSEEIAEISIKLGADVPFLREEFSDDISPVSLATLSALIQSEEYWGLSFNNVTQLMANCPLRNQQDIINFDKEFHERDTNFLLSCFKFGWMNPWWSFTMNQTHKHKFLFEAAIKQRSQDLEDLFCPTGSIWMADVKQFKVDKTFYGKEHQFNEISWVSAIDIDDETDLEFAKAVSISTLK